ncbi:MAG: ATP synthase F1 subunit delta [Candidatus Zixiibacteriota bacterium]
MIESRISRKYAAALFSTAKRINQVEAMSRDLDAVSDLLRKNRVLTDLLESPQIAQGEKKELISTVLKGRISEALFSFLALVLSKHRIQYLLSMSEEFQSLVRRHQGIVQARVGTAHATEPALLEKIRRQLEKNTGKKVEMETEIDSSLIGGIVIVLDDKIIDKSIRHQLRRLKEQMMTSRAY